MEKIGKSLEKLKNRTAAASNQTWPGVEVVDYFRQHFDIPEKGPWGYAAYLRRIKELNINIDHARRLVMIMKKREAWLLRVKKEKLHRGKWMFNRFIKEIKEQGIERFIIFNG